MGIEVVRDEADKKQFDALALKNRDPEKHYRWSRDRDMSIARHRFNGYDIVDATSDKVRSVCDDTTRMKKGVDVDNAIRLGDMVLMATSKDNHNERMKEEALKVSRQTKGVTEGYKHAVARLGGERLGFEEHDDRHYAGDVSERDFDRQQEEERARRRR